MPTLMMSIWARETACRGRSPFATNVRSVVFLFAFEVCGALFYEGSRTLEMIFRREHQMLAVPLVVEKIRQIKVQSDSQCFLREALGERGLCCDLFRECRSRFAEF